MRIDKQQTTGAPRHAIPIISPVLHFFAMPALVFWRHRFGYLFLRPKSVFLSCCVATGLLSYIVFNEPAIRPLFSGVAAFSITVSILYLLHLIRCSGSQIAKSADHDLNSGTSHLLAFWPASQRMSQERFIHIVAEPALTLLAGIVLAWSCISPLLGYCLMGAAVALILKEMTNAWLTLRTRKVMKDRLDRVQDEMPEHEQSDLPLPGIEGKKRREKRPRNSDT